MLSVSGFQKWQKRATSHYKNSHRPNPSAKLGLDPCINFVDLT